MSLRICLNPNHYIFVQHQSKQWTLSENDVSMWVHQFNKVTTLVGDVDDAGGYMHMWKAEEYLRTF